MARLGKGKMSRQNAIAVSAAILTMLFAVAIGVLPARGDSNSTPQLQRGEQIYKSACVACHGTDGRGMTRSIAGFKRPHTFPDFTRCDQTTAENNISYEDIITNGGPARGFSQIMPSFGQALTPQDIDAVVHYLRAFCTNKHWPRGELNLPRALVTEKAYPEDEVVLSTAVNAQGAPGNFSHVIYEQRFGMNNQLEVDVPITFENEDHIWYGGLGDTSVGVKRVMFSSLRTGSILSLQGSLIIPTGSAIRGLGTGTPAFETFAAFDQLFKTNTFIQTQFGAQLPTDTTKAPQNVYFYSALGQSIGADHGLGRLWTPMVEFLASRDLVNQAKTDWDLLPQMQVTLSKRQHVAADLGVRVPVTDTAGRQIQIMFYIFWDMQDGKLTEGW